MKKVTILLVALMIFLAGCTSTGTSAGTGNGLTFELSSDTDDPQPKDTITLTAIISNLGEADATQIYVELLSTVGLDLEGQTRKQVQTESVRRGDTDEVSWNINIPDVQMETSYSPFARLCYVYETIGYQDVFVTGSKWKETIPKLNSDVSAAPLDMNFEAKEQYKGEKQNTYAKINVFNKGDGSVFNNTGIITLNNLASYENGQIGVLTEMKIIVPKSEGLIGITDSNPSSCLGTPTPCFNIIDSSVCNNQVECDWEYGADNAGVCSGTARNCVFLQDAECTSQEGCEWKYSSELDSGSFTCQEDSDQFTCSATQDNLKLINKEEKSFRILFDTHPASETSQQTVRLTSTATYRYCIESGPLSITVSPDI